MSGWPDWHIVVGLVLTLAGSIITVEVVLDDLRKHRDPNAPPPRLLMALRRVFARWLPPPRQHVGSARGSTYGVGTLTARGVRGPNSTDRELIEHLQREVQELRNMQAEVSKTLVSLREADRDLEQKLQGTAKRFEDRLRGQVVERAPAQLWSLFLVASGAVLLTLPNHGPELTWTLVGFLAAVTVATDVVGWHVLWRGLVGVKDD